MTRILRLLGLPLGVAVVVWLVLQSDPAALFGVFPRIGWGFVAIVMARAVTVVIDCGAWRCLLPRRDRPSFTTMLPLRWIAESINTTLPAAQIGGEGLRAHQLQSRVEHPAPGAAPVPGDICPYPLEPVPITILWYYLLVHYHSVAQCPCTHY